MLKRFKQFSHSWPAKILFGLLLLSLASFLGMREFFSGGGSQTIATVGSKSVLVKDLQRRLAMYQSFLETRFGRTVSKENLRASGIVGRVFNEALLEAVLDDEAERMGLVVSDRSLQKALLTDRRFQDQAGQFSQNIFMNFLRREGLNERVFLAQQRAILVRQQVLEALRMACAKPSFLTKIVMQAYQQKRSVSWRRLAVQDISLGGEKPANSVLENYLKKNSLRFQKPQQRCVLFGCLPLKVSGQKTPDSVRTSEELLTRIHRMEDALGGQASLAEVAQEEGVSLKKMTITEFQDLGENFGKVTVEDQEKIKGKVFSLTADDAPVFVRLSSGDRVVLQVTDVKPARFPPLSEIKPAVLQAWQQERKQELLKKKATLLQKSLRSGKTEAGFRRADLFGIKDMSPEKNRTGLPLPVLEHAFKMAAGEVMLVDLETEIYLLQGLQIQSNPSDGKMLKGLTDSLNNALEVEILTAYLNALRSQRHVQINQQALNLASMF